MPLFSSATELTPVTLPADAGVRLAAERMEETAVGCVVVVGAGGEPCGLVTDRDLLVRVLSRPVDPATISIGEVMSTPLVTGRTDEGVDVWIDRMKRRGIRRLPLVGEGGELIGIVSLDDMIGELAGEVADLGRETRTRVGRTRRRLELQHVRSEVDRRLEQVYQRLRHANWAARDAILHQIDQLRDSLRDDD